MELGMSEGRQRLSAEARKEEIIRVTMDLAAKRGLDNVTTQDMAEAMGLTQGAIFRHFQTKDDIWLAVMQWIREQLMKVLGKAAAQGSDPLDAISKMFFAHITFIVRHPAIPRVLFSEYLHGRNSNLRHLIQEIILGYENKIAALLLAGKNEGLVREQVNERSAAILYIGMIQGLVLRASIFREKKALIDEAKSVFSVFLDGVAVAGHADTVRR